MGATGSPDHHNVAFTRHGVIGVIVRADRFLVIRRSQSVVAPGMYCFPGGGIEAGETESEALTRELHEEIGVAGLIPRRRLWTNVTPRQVHLAWWQVALDDPDAVCVNPSEVESHHWWTIDELFGETNLLESNRQFLHALQRGEFLLDMRTD